MKAPVLARWLAVLAEVGLVDCRIPTEASAREGADRADRKPNIVLTAAPVGGSWVSCYANYRPTSTAEREVTRLGLMCGSENGMAPFGPVLTGEASSAEEEHVIEVEQGECLRIFAVSEHPVADLAVEVKGPRGGRVASDHNSDRWPILNAEGPFCLLESGKHSIHVRARRATGRYALQVWHLSP